MTIELDGAPKRIGLALSGGGFRAAAFHLGVFRRLHSVGLLQAVDLISCVSGGSIAGAFLAAGWNDLPKTLDALETYLKNRSIAVSSVIGGLLDPFETRTDKLAESYDRDLFGDRTLEDLAGGPRLYLNATNLATGNLFFFVTGGGNKPRAGFKNDIVMGDYELGVRDAKRFRLSRAVAASSSFPPVFPPLRLDNDEFPPTPTVEYVTLTDGGVYDNLGINPHLAHARNQLDFAIVSDAGSPFAVDARPTESGVGVLTSLIQILMEQVRSLQFDRMQHRHAAGKGPRPLWFSIDSHEGEVQSGDAMLASAVGTNLARLSTAEMTILTRHAGALVESRLKKYAPELLTAAVR
jgi:NTE family protein